MTHVQAAFDGIGRLHGAVLERLDIGIILVDEEARPTFMNRRATRIVAYDDGLGVDDGGVRAGSAAETCALRATIAIAASSASQVREPNRLYLERPSGLTSLVVTVMSLDGTTIGPSCSAPRAALFVVDPAAPIRIDTRGLSETYGLTPREASVAAMLSRGADIAQAAETLGVCTATARQYLKRALDKTGTHRQANLVRLVLQTFTDFHG